MKTKTSLTSLIKQHDFGYVSDYATGKNFPPQEPSEVKFFDFDEPKTSEEVIAAMKAEGYEPASIYDVLPVWNGEDHIACLGQVWRDPDGDLGVLYLDLWLGQRYLHCSWFDRRWRRRCRFPARRPRNGSQPSELSNSLDTLPSELVINGIKYTRHED